MRLSPGLKAAMTKCAKADRRSIASWIETVLWREIERHGMEECPLCSANGWGEETFDEDGNPDGVETCDGCHGSGYIERKRRHPAVLKEMDA